MTSELAWYDRILIFLPVLYRPRIFALIALAVLCFWGVKLNWGLDWDVVLTSYFFLSVCSLLTFLTAAWCFHARHFQLRHAYMIIDLLLLGIALVLGDLALRDHEYIYQGEYKFRRQWRKVESPPDLLTPLKGDPRQYSEKWLWQTSIEPISSSASMSVEMHVLVSEDDCHILQSRPEFAWKGPVVPKAIQVEGSSWKQSKEHTWELSKMKKQMRVVLNVAIGSTASTLCLPSIEVKEQ